MLSLLGECSYRDTLKEVLKVVCTFFFKSTKFAPLTNETFTVSNQVALQLTAPSLVTVPMCMVISTSSIDRMGLWTEMEEASCWVGKVQHRRSNEA